MQTGRERKNGRASVAAPSLEGDNDAAETPAEMKLSPTEAEVIALFVQLARIIGLPRSYAEIYGMLFISPRPLALDDLIDCLGVSRGSASQGLRYLTSVGAIKVVYTRGQRRIHYVAVAELRNLVMRFLNERVVPHLDSSLERIEHVKQMARNLPADQRGHLESRLTMLHSWQKKSRRFLGVVSKLLG